MWKENKDRLKWFEQKHSLETEWWHFRQGVTGLVSSCAAEETWTRGRTWRCWRRRQEASFYQHELNSWFRASASFRSSSPGFHSQRTGSQPRRLAPTLHWSRTRNLWCQGLLKNHRITKLTTSQQHQHPMFSVQRHLLLNITAVHSDQCCRHAGY